MVLRYDNCINEYCGVVGSVVGTYGRMFLRESPVTTPSDYYWFMFTMGLIHPFTLTTKQKISTILIKNLKISY